jgi:excisionase family DNA binding protein
MGVAETILSSTQAAQLLGVSRQHMADLADRGAITSWRAGSHRRFHRDDVVAYRAHLQEISNPAEMLASMNLTDRRSLGYGLLTAAKLVAQPERVIGVARQNLGRLREVHSGSSAVL